MKGPQRQHQRFPCIGIVEIKEKQNDGPSRIVSAMLNNISRTGLKCNATKSLKKSTPVSLRIMEFMGEKTDEKISGRVIWQLGSGRSYYLGIQFDRELDHDNYPHLCHLICEHMDNDPEFAEDYDV
jgi:hypothetical protein